MEGFYGPADGLRGAKKYRDIVELVYQAKTGVGIACLSETNGNELMWAHYADNYAGICVEYDTRALVEGLSAGVRVVRLAYGDAPPTIDKDDASDVKRAAIKILSHKKANWAYEREWRILGKMGINEYGDRKCIKGIYFGSRINRTLREQIIKSLPRLGISFFDMKVTGYRHIFTRVTALGRRHKRKGAA